MNRPAAERPPIADPGVWADATLAAALIAVDPAGLGGAAVRAPAGPVRDQWLALLRHLLGSTLPQRRLPMHIRDERLLGGLDLGATLQAGRPVAQRGLLAESDGGLVLVAMAERLPPATAARLAAALDRGEVVVERDGIAMRHPTRFGVIALDEGIGADEQVPAALVDRLALHLDLSEVSPRDALEAAAEDVDAQADIAEARRRLPAVALPDAMLQAICAASVALGIASLRPSLLALAVARAHAALRGSAEVEAEDASAAVRLVMVPRATLLPSVAGDESPDETPDEPPEDTPAEAEAPPPSLPDDEARDDPPDEREDEREQEDDDDPPPPLPDGALDEMVLEAALAALPPGLLARLKATQAAQQAGRAAGKAGALQKSGHRGRPAGVRRGEPRGGLRLNVIETLRAAAPWQTLRRQVRQANEADRAGRTDRAGGAGRAGRSDPADPADRAARAGRADAVDRVDRAARPGAAQGADASAAGVADAARRPAAPARRIEVRPDDFHVSRFRPRRETTTIFAVDASGSSALARLAEAKGAVELLLADCYIRRDRVAVLAFRGRGAELLLPPTRSLVRAKRSLAGLPGGGGTPLAAAIDAAGALAESISRRGETPVIVLLTDGRANVALDGTGGRARAEADALGAAQRLRLNGCAVLLIDTSPQPHPQAARLAAEMRGTYLPLPMAGAAGLSQVVRAASTAASTRR